MIGLQGSFSFDDFFNELASGILPAVLDEGEAAPPIPPPDAGTTPGFVEADKLGPVFKEARRELIELSRQVC